MEWTEELLERSVTVMQNHRRLVSDRLLRTVARRYPVLDQPNQRAGSKLDRGVLRLRVHVAAENVGGIRRSEEILFYQYEEIDLSYRLLAQGHRIYYDPSLAIVHHRTDSPCHSEGASLDAAQYAFYHSAAFSDLPDPDPVDPASCSIWASPKVGSRAGGKG